MKTRLLLAIGILLFASLLNCLNAASSWNIVHKDAAAEAMELQIHLEKATNRPCATWEEDAFDGNSTAFYIGHTNFARKNGIDFSAFQPDGWAYKSVGENVILTGHSHEGTQNAVYNFLENELGIRWYTFESCHIPEYGKNSFVGLDRQGCPAFVLRGIYMPPWGQKQKDNKSIFLFQKRNRLNGYSSVHSPTSRRSICHTFYDYVNPELYFNTHPEYFSMNQEGQRFHGNNQAGGQLCMSNPDVADIAAKTLERFILDDREKLPKDKWPVIYDISQLDNTSYLCLCPKCAELSEKEGSDAALVLTFINRIANMIRPSWPGIVIRTMAYVSSEMAPKTMRPAENVLIQVCDLYTRSDCYRPLTHEFNAERRKIFDSWKAKGARIAIWDYWNMGIEGVYFDPPRIETMVDAIAEDFRYFKSIGVEDIFAEAETNLFSNPQNFYDLQFWLGAKLLENPALDEEKLIADFMKNHYGPAAGPMTEFLNLVREAIRNEKSPLFYIVNPSRTYQTPDFFKRSYQLLKHAQSLTAPDTPFRLRVEKEMITPLAVMLLHRESGFDKEMLAKEYEACRLRQINAHAAPDQMDALKKNLAADVQKYTFNPDIPEKFKDIPPDRIRQFAYPVFTTVEDEPGSPLGKALVSPDKEVPGSSEHIMKPQAGSLYPTSFGVYDSDSKKGVALHITDIPTDEQYHWYEIGEFDFGKNTFLWAWFWLRNANLRSVWTNADGIDGYNQWNVWISVRITGPAYVKGSQQKNAVRLDRIALIKK